MKLILLFRFLFFRRNCNHFTSDFCRRLVGRSAPGWINRAAKIGTMFPCVVPTEWVEPPESESYLLLFFFFLLKKTIRSPVHGPRVTKLLLFPVIRLFDRARS